MIRPILLPMLVLATLAAAQSTETPTRTPAETVKHLQEIARLQKVPADGYVPDAKTAVRIAEAVLIPVYGMKQIAWEEPFIATLDNDVWTVSGTLNCKSTATIVCVGGTAVVQLSKKDRRN